MDFPEIATYSEVAKALRLSKSTLYSMVSRKELKRGIYIGQGRFNMTRLKDCVVNEGSILRGRKR